MSKPWLQTFKSRAPHSHNRYPPTTTVILINTSKMVLAFALSPCLHPSRISFQSSHRSAKPRFSSRTSQIRACSIPPTHQPEDLWQLPDLAPLSQMYKPTHEEETDISGNDPPAPPQSDDRGRDDESGDRESLLRKFGRDDHPDLKTLSDTQLAAYLKASQSAFTKYLCRIWPGFRRRVAADPDFPFKVLMELTVGLGLAASGMIAARGDRILAELDFAFCDIAVGGTLNFILVYLLTPSIGAAKGGFGSGLPASVFSPGKYGVASRVGAFLYKGGLFAGCGFAGSMLGTSLSQGLLFVRKTVAKFSGKETEERELPNVFVNSAAWAGFMLVSSNPRYQTVAGLERALFGLAPESVAKIGSAALRTANNVLGGANWVQWAKFIGLQKTEQDVEEKVEEE